MSQIFTNLSPDLFYLLLSHRFTLKQTNRTKHCSLFKSKSLERPALDEAGLHSFVSSVLQAPCPRFGLCPPARATQQALPKGENTWAHLVPQLRRLTTREIPVLSTPRTSPCQLFLFYHMKILTLIRGQDKVLPFLRSEKYAVKQAWL